jgi:hypothetical protein
MAGAPGLLPAHRTHPPLPRRSATQHRRGYRPGSSLNLRAFRKRKVEPSSSKAPSIFGWSFFAQPGLSRAPSRGVRRCRGRGERDRGGSSTGHCAVPWPQSSGDDRLSPGPSAVPATIRTFQRRAGRRLDAVAIALSRNTPGTLAQRDHEARRGDARPRATSYAPVGLDGARSTGRGVRRHWKSRQFSTAAREDGFRGKEDRRLSRARRDRRAAR